ncbi:MAG: maltose alpha-D-glucosyltransferase [Dehalococcoidia bacterium]
MTTRRIRPPLSDNDPLWYRDAVIYETHVKAFRDSNDDGIGDFRGLTRSLDYLQDLGVTALWLLPFYPSPLRDDGYDTADYTRIHENYGTMRDFRAFMREAERRDLRVITELVVNHTSDQHEWFQRARRARPGSWQRDFYVWSDTPDKYSEARIIFQDFEASNWTWDPIAKSYYWHRFYSHQPDLNYENPRVREAVFRLLDFWMEMGVSGLRLDAVPYLFEREGTNCENLPETHQFLKDLRRHMDTKYPGRMLLAEANQWPEDAVAYFGDGDECNMNFHFPLMPRLFMGVRMEDYTPIADILEQTPKIPDNSQWAIFLRNHDELTLEMVTDEERDYMYRMYAHDRDMRINLGIRRRLAPLLSNDRRKIELMNGLLFSLPGAPVLYYGDEIGMGDNFFLGDRNGVRTPMQWNGDRNAGFSRANPHRLYLPVIIDPEYHYEAINVEVQQSNPDSLLWWMRRLISMRKRYKAFSRGDVEMLRPGNQRVLAFLRRYEDEVILVVANLSRHVQHVALELPQLQGCTPVELSSSNEFPPIGDSPYSLTLGAYNFFWFKLEPVKVEASRQAQAAASGAGPVLDLRRRTWANLFRTGAPEPLANILVDNIRGRRWFGGKARRIQSASIRDAIAVPYGNSQAHLVFLRLEYREGEPDTYLVSLALASGEKAEKILADHPESVISRARATAADGGPEALVYDALVEPEFGRALFDVIARRRRLGPLDGAQLSGSHTPAFRSLRSGMNTQSDPKLVGVEQSNTSLIFDDKFILKLFRRPGEGINPDLEIGRKLTGGKNRFPNTAPVAGALEYAAARNGPPTTIGIMHSYVHNVGDAWAYTLHALDHYYEWAMAHPEVDAPPAPGMSPLDLCGTEPSQTVMEAIGPYLVSARLLGQRTAELHMALAADGSDPAFAPERFTRLYQRSLNQGVRTNVLETIRTLRRRLSSLDEAARQDARTIIERESALVDRLGALTDHRIDAFRSRTHGDYHLGQVLYTGQDFMIIDFEGEPARPLSERRLKRSPIRDVAGMIRSFHYAVHSAMRSQTDAMTGPGEDTDLQKWGRTWYSWVASAFLDEYLNISSESDLLPHDRADLAALLDVYLINKAVYEVLYELNNRPDWVHIPLQGLLDLAETSQ